MNSSMLELLFGKEAIERAKKRGRAYMCLVCHQLTGERRVGELGPMEDHVLKTHVSRDRVPYYCRLCMFKCQTKYQMDHHTRHYSRHVKMAQIRGIVNHEEWQVRSPVPYKIGEADLMKFSQEESALFFLKRQTMEAQSRPSTATKGPGETISEDLMSETIGQGYFRMPGDLSLSNHAMQGVEMPEGARKQITPTLSPAVVSGLRHPASSSCRLGSPVQFSPLIGVGLRPTSCNLAPVRTTTPPAPYIATPLTSPNYRLLTTPETGETDEPGTFLSFPQQPLQPHVTLITERAEDPTVAIGLRDTPVTVLPGTAAVAEFHSTMASIARCSGTVEPTSLSQAACVDTPEMVTNSRTEPHLNKKDEEEEIEDLWSQLMSKDDLGELTDVPTPSEPVQHKRKQGHEKVMKTPKELARQEDQKSGKGQEESEPPHKKSRTEEPEPPFESNLVAVNALTTAIQHLAGQMTRNEERQEKVEKALTEMSCSLSKVTDALNRMRNVLEESLREERRREDHWDERERRREEERRKDRKAEQRREERRREAERKEREEIRRLLKERKDGKENSKRMKSVLGKAYTENSVKEYNKKK